MKKLLSLLLVISVIIGITVFARAATLVGDVDKNGKVNSSDALTILQYSVGQIKNIDKNVADTNGDGKINSTDALKVLQISIGQVQGGTVKETTTKKTTTTTKKTIKYDCPYEVTPNTDVTMPSGIKAKMTRAWSVKKFSGLDIKIARLEEAKIKQKFDSSINSQIANTKTVEYAPACTIAVITCDSPTRLNVSKGTQKRTTQENATSVGAVIAIDGTKGSYNTDKSATIRSGAVYQKFTGTNAKQTRLIMYKDGKWEFKALDNTAANTAVKNGAYNSLYLQDITIQNGVVTAGLSDNPYRNRTFLGQISANKYVFMTTECMPIKDAAEIMLKYGVKNAAQICGGNCTFMYLQGVGNSTKATGASLIKLDKLGYIETELFANYGLFSDNRKGGPCDDEMDCIYFK